MRAVQGWDAAADAVPGQVEAENAGVLEQGYPVVRRKDLDGAALGPLLLWG